jgi:PAS domain S-box-containing protein
VILTREATAKACSGSRSSKVSRRAYSRGTGVLGLAAIVESSDDAIMGLNLDGIFTSWNKGTERLFGYLAEEVIGKPVKVLIPPDRHNEEPAILERIKRGECVEHYETVRRHKDGSSIDISLTVSPVKNIDGKIIGASKIARDITERKRSEAHIALLEHRVKNILATVQATVQLSHRGMKPLPPAYT